MGAPDGCRRGLRHPEVPHFALTDQILDRAGDVLDRDLGIDAVLIEEIDRVYPQQAQ
jgi:hypothetical protein